MDDNQHLELENATLDNEEIEQPDTWDDGNIKQEEEAKQTADVVREANKINYLKSKLADVEANKVNLEDLPPKTRQGIEDLQLSNEIDSFAKLNNGSTQSDSLSKEDIVKQVRADLLLEQNITSNASTPEEAQATLEAYQSIKSRAQWLTHDEIMLIAKANKPTAPIIGTIAHWGAAPSVKSSTMSYNDISQLSQGEYNKAMELVDEWKLELV